MPHLRFTRDRRGYENTFILRSDRSSGREKPSIIYWFRTPPDIRVGRTALDDEAIRALEAEHPEIRFDWARLREARNQAAGRASDALRRGQGQQVAAQGKRQRRRRSGDFSGAGARPQEAAPANPEVPHGAAAYADQEPDIEVSDQAAANSVAVDESGRAATETPEETSD